MKIKFQYIALITVIAGIQSVTAQKKDENIGTEVVNVVKPYTPTVSDAFKVKETPVIEDEENTQKKNIEYNIFSYPVASTFSPEKGRAASVEREAREKYFSNYATLGVGNYGTVNAELFVTQELEDSKYVGGMLRHLSSQGDIDGVWLDNNYSNTSIDLTYGSRQKELSWNADLGFQNQVYNWYGLPQDFLLENNPGLDVNGYISDIDPKQTYNSFYIGGRLAADDSFFEEANLQYKRFWDGYDAAENRFFVTPSFDVDVMEEKIKVGVVADYVGGTFANTYTYNDANNPVSDEESKYSSLNFGIQPSILYQKEDISVQIGAGLFYSMGKQNDDTNNKFFVYPQVKASFNVVGDLMIAYAGAEGTLQQNSYADFAGQNPFVMPALYVTPTDQKYDVYVGLKGKLASTVAYNIRGSYKNEDSRAFFVNGSFTTPEQNFGYGNAFRVVYDNLKTIGFFGELKGDFSDKVTAGVNAEFNSYTTDVYEEAWNLPQIKVGANLDVDITEKWDAGANIYFVGERKDLAYSTDGLQPGDLYYQQSPVTVDSYFDLNARVGYKYNERLSGFVRLNNILGQNYERWVNYQVQGFQFMVGASYKFNF